MEVMNNFNNFTIMEIEYKNEDMEPISEETEPHQETDMEKLERRRLEHNARVRRYLSKRYKNDDNFRLHRIELVRNYQNKIGLIKNTYMNAEELEILKQEKERIKEEQKLNRKEEKKKVQERLKLFKEELKKSRQSK